MPSPGKAGVRKFAESRVEAGSNGCRRILFSTATLTRSFPSKLKSKIASGMSGSSWPDRLIADMPNFYLYAANNPSEGTIAKRRSAATLISYLTPPISAAGLYRGLLDLKASIERWRGLEPEADAEREQLLPVIQAQAAQVELASAEPEWTFADGEGHVAKLWAAVLELEYTLIPDGLHVIGEPMTAGERLDLLKAAAEARPDYHPADATLEAIVAGARPEDALAKTTRDKSPEAIEAVVAMSELNRLLSEEHELGALVHALDGRFVRPAPSGDLIRQSRSGDRAALHGLNKVGLQRHGFSQNTIANLKKAYRIIFRIGLTVNEAVERVLAEVENIAEVMNLVNFIKMTQRGITR